MNYKIVFLASFILGSFFTCAQGADSLSDYIQEKQRDSVLLPDNKLMLTQISDTTIIERGWYTRTLHQFGSGLLLAHGATWKSEGEWSQVSKDGGVKWYPYVKTDDKDHSLISSYMSTLSDGSVIGWAEWVKRTTFTGRPGKPFKQLIMRASSLDEVIKGHGIEEDVMIHLPYTVPRMGDDLRIPPNYDLAIWGKLIEGEHGHLIQATYPSLAYDSAPRLWAEQKVPVFKYRTCVIYSQDDGTTWHYLATVASPEQFPLPSESEGYCEPDLLHFGDGRMLCVMRSGGNPHGSLMERYTPLFSSHSQDGGVTWAPPEPISPYGVAPVLLQMQSGLVVCLSGRPGFFLLFSTDEGKSWSPPHWVSKSNGSWSRSSSGYGRLIELKPGILGVAYDEFAGEGDDARMVTKFRSYAITISNPIGNSQ